MTFEEKKELINQIFDDKGLDTFIVLASKDAGDHMEGLRMFVNGEGPSLAAMVTSAIEQSKDFEIALEAGIMGSVL